MQATTSNLKAGRAPIAILGVPFDSVTTDETLTLAAEMITTRQPHYVATANVDFLVQALEDVEMRRILFDAHLVLAEDKTVVWASKKLGNELPAALPLAALVIQLLGLAEQKNWRIFLLGADEAMAGKVRARFPKLQIVGSHVPPEKPLLEMDHGDILQRLRETKPDILLVAFGSPRQEKWISMNFRESGVPLSLGAGPNFDFLAGHVKAVKPRESLKFVWLILQQWWRLRGKKKKNATVAAADVMPDPYGNFLIRSPADLGATAVQAAQTEWLRAVENSNVLFDLTDTTFVDSTGVGALIRLRKRSRELGHQFYLISPRPQVLAALKLMKLDEFFTIQASVAGVRILMESAAGSSPVSSDVQEKELQIRWAGEVTALNAVELGAYTESELAQVSPGMSVIIDLSRVTFVDSTGIGLMVRFKKNLQRQDVHLKFANASRSVLNVILQTKLEEFLLR